jgi:class 3 adenylate cyclase/tetratricopeptide (TPR) repeat protein
MRCTACGHDNRDTAAFCESCGGRLAVACARCSNELRPGARFCDGCGQAVATPVEPSHAPARHAQTPRHLAEKILASRAALEGERKQVTVLFADIVGSTALIRDRDAEEAQRLLDGAVQQMMAAVHRYEGTVSRLMGDGLMAMFGAPVAHENHAVQACYAALAMLEAVREYADEVRQVHGVAIQIRVGINSGEVVVRLISDDLHMDYTAMGQTVHLASRLEGLANAGTTLLSPSTLALAEGLIDVRPLGPTTVKGLEQPVEVFELRGAGMARTRLQAAAARGLTPFVGRQEERAAIDRALARVRAGHGQVVALVAEAGVGKSRLVWEATHSDRASDFTGLQTGAVSYGQTTAWLPVSDLLRHYFAIESRDDRAAMRTKVISGMQALDPALAPDLPALLSLLDLPVDDAAWAALDPPRRRAATLDALRRLVLRESQEQPLLLVFEDLHWIDGETQALLDDLIEAIPTARILLLVNYRPEYTHGWGGKSYYTQLPIDPLGQASAEEMLDGALGNDPTVQPLKGLLVSRTEGNPFFLEESVRALAETGVLVGVRGAYRLSRPVENIHIPATVQAVLAARIDRLPPKEKRLLQTASVIGKDVPFALLQAVSDPSDGDLQATLSRLQSAELLYAVSLYPEPEYTFKHALTHEVAYGSLLQERRKALHGRVVDSIERAYAGRREEHVERLAHHTVRADRWEQAVAYCRQAGSKAQARSVAREAASWFEQGLVALHQLGDSREVIEQAIDLRIDLRNALVPLGEELARGMSYLREAEALAQQLGDTYRLGRVSVAMLGYFVLTGDLPQAVSCAERAWRLGVELADRPLQMGAIHALGQAYIRQGDYRRARDHENQMLQLLAKDGGAGREYLGTSMPLLLGGLAFLTWSLAELGEFTDGLRHGEEAIRIAEDVGNVFGLIHAIFGLGLVNLRRGEVGKATVTLERGLDICRSANLQTAGFHGVASFLGETYVLAARPEDAIPLLQRVTEQSLGLGMLADFFIAAVPLGNAYMITDRHDDALRVAAQAADLSRKHDFRANHAWALRLLGMLHAEPTHGDETEARGFFLDGLSLAQELGMRPLQAHCHLGLGTLYRRAGRVDEARAELTTAVAMLSEMGMAFWLPEAERELAAVTE